MHLELKLKISDLDVEKLLKKFRKSNLMMPLYFCLFYDMTHLQFFIYKFFVFPYLQPKF